MSTRYDQAAELLDKLAALPNLEPATLATMAVGNALLSLVEIVEVAVANPPAEPAVPFEQTRDGWTWGTE